MRNFVWILLIFLLLALKFYLVNWVLLLVVAGVLFSDLDEMLVLAVAGGVISDLVSGSPDGLISLTLLSTGLTMYLIFNKLLSRHANRAVLIGSTAFAHFLFTAWFWVYAGIFGVSGNAVLFNPWQFLFTMALAYPVFQLYLLIDELIPRHNAQPIRE